jgi:hypothetical protein
LYALKGAPRGSRGARAGALSAEVGTVPSSPSRSDSKPFWRVLQEGCGPQDRIAGSEGRLPPLDSCSPKSAAKTLPSLATARPCEGPTRGLESVSTEATSRQALDRFGKRFGARGTPPGSLAGQPSEPLLSGSRSLAAPPEGSLSVRTIRTDSARRCFCAEPQGVSRGSPCNATREKTAFSASRSPIAT